MLAKLYTEVISGFRNIYGRFWATTQGHSEYYLKLDGYYFCEKKNCIMVVIQVRNKRTVEIMPVKKIVNDRNFVKELHPVDACSLGILSNNERNGIVDTSCNGWKKMKRVRQRYCFIKCKPILQIVKKYFDSEGREITVLFSSFLKKEISMQTVDLSKNEALLYALDAVQAISVGYGASELYIRRNLGG